MWKSGEDVVVVFSLRYNCLGRLGRLVPEYGQLDRLRLVGEVRNVGR